ncbi:hypothetical protein [Bradyrhizobium sp. JR3.5]
MPAEAQRLNQERGRIEVEHQLQAARRLGAEQGDDRASPQRRALRRRGERQELVVDQRHVRPAVDIGAAVPCKDVDPETLELAPDDGGVALVLDGDERLAPAQRK